MALERPETSALRGSEEAYESFDEMMEIVQTTLRQTIEAPDEIIVALEMTPPSIMSEDELIHYLNQPMFWQALRQQLTDYYLAQNERQQKMAASELVLLFQPIVAFTGVNYEFDVRELIEEQSQVFWDGTEKKVRALDLLNQFGDWQSVMLSCFQNVPMYTQNRVGAYQTLFHPEHGVMARELANFMQTHEVLEVCQHIIGNQIKADVVRAAFLHQEILSNSSLWAAQHIFGPYEQAKNSVYQLANLELVNSLQNLMGYFSQHGFTRCLELGAGQGLLAACLDMPVEWYPIDNKGWNKCHQEPSYVEVHDDHLFNLALNGPYQETVFFCSWFPGIVSGGDRPYEQLPGNELILQVMLMQQSYPVMIFVGEPAGFSCFTEETLQLMKLKYKTFVVPVDMIAKMDFQYRNIYPGQSRTIMYILISHTWTQEVQNITADELIDIIGPENLSKYPPMDQLPMIMNVVVDQVTHMQHPPTVRAIDQANDGKSVEEVSRGFDKFIGSSQGMNCCQVCQVIGGQMLRCARCHRSKYCSEACQRKDWKSHKMICWLAA